MSPIGDTLTDLHRDSLRARLVRMILADRVIPPPTPLLAALALIWAAAPALMLAEEGRRALIGAVAVGLVPLLVQRVGELAVTYLFPLAEAPTPGQVLDLPQQFVTGPLLLWLAFKEGPAPNWLGPQRPGQPRNPLVGGDLGRWAAEPGRSRLDAMACWAPALRAGDFRARHLALRTYRLLPDPGDALASSAGGPPDIKARSLPARTRNGSLPVAVGRGLQTPQVGPSPTVDLRGAGSLWYLS